MRPGQRTGPDAANIGTGDDMGGNLKSGSNLRHDLDGTGHCCLAMGMPDRFLAAELGLFCGDGRCARERLGSCTRPALRLVGGAS